MKDPQGGRSRKNKEKKEAAAGRSCSNYGNEEAFRAPVDMNVI